ncbi:MAG: STAS domain-containing protein [Chthoniobacterales bacterium]
MSIDRSLRDGHDDAFTPHHMPKSDSQNVFAPEGAIDLHVSPELRTSLRELIDRKPKVLVIDLAEVPYIDSSGLAVLIGAMQSLEHDGGAFRLAGAQTTVRTILESARLDQYFHLYPTVEEALAAS